MTKTVEAPEFKPESLDALRARFPQAIQKQFRASWFGRPGGKPPHRRHIFDFEDGVRLVVSWDKIPKLGWCIHASLSLQTEEGIARFQEQVKAEHTSVSRLLGRYMGQRITQLWEGPIPYLRFLAYDPEKHVIHFACMEQRGK